MNREDAYYFKILLMSGINDGYDEWLNNLLEVEHPLSDVVLELSFCGSNTKNAVSVLHNYCKETGFNESIVCEKLRLYLKNAYYSNRFTKDEVISLMYRFALCHGDPGDFDTAVWGDMFYMDDYYMHAKDGIFTMERFDSVFFAFLNDGVPVTDLIWEQKQKKTSLFDKIKRIFAKKK